MAVNCEVGCHDIQEKVVNDKTELQKFDALFSSLQDDLASVWQAHEDVNDAISWFKEVNEYNVPYGKKIRGLAVANSYRLLVRNYSEEDLNRARILGWCVEWLLASFLETDDIMDRSLTRRGKPCWYKKAEVGIIAINDGFYLENAVYFILKKYFRSLPCYISLVELFQQVCLQTIFGQNLDLLSASSPGDFSKFTLKNCQAIAKWKTAYFCYLPCACAMYLANIFDDHLHNIARSILLKFGELFQFQNDFLDCFGDADVVGKVGTDIEENKLTWLIVQALSLANNEQLQVLKDNYGQTETDHVNKVKEVYRQLNLTEKFKEYKETTQRELVDMIEQLNNNNQLPKEMFYSINRKSYN